MAKTQKIMKERSSEIMLKNEREREIIKLLKENGGFVKVNELCDKLYASQSSIRRDLSALEGRGIIKRSYGGAELVTNFSNVVEFGKRSNHNVQAKRIIAKKAAEMVQEGNVIFLDQSSTSFYLAAELMHKKGITVVTNNIEIISLLADSAVKVISSGGVLSDENRTCLIGADAQYIFEHIYADIVFFSCKLLSEDGIISDCTREEVLVRNSMLKNAAKKVFLCDSEKIGIRSVYEQCRLKDVDVMVSEK